MTELTAGLLAGMLSDVVDETEERSNASAGFHEEAQFRAGLFAKLRQQMPDLFPIAEAAYFDEHWRERCDICLLRGKTPVAWIEMKKAWLGVGKGWNAKPAEQLRKLLWDVAKVAYQMKVETESDSYGYLAVFFYNQQKLPFAPDVVEGSALRAGECIERLCDWYKVKEPARQRAWGALGLSEEMGGNELRAQYVRCLKLVGADVEVRIPRNTPVKPRLSRSTPADGIWEYQIIAARLHK